MKEISAKGSEIAGKKRIVKARVRLWKGRYYVEVRFGGDFLWRILTGTHTHPGGSEATIYTFDDPVYCAWLVRDAQCRVQDPTFLPIWDKASFEFFEAPRAGPDSWGRTLKGWVRIGREAIGHAVAQSAADIVPRLRQARRRLALKVDRTDAQLECDLIRPETTE